MPSLASLFSKKSKSSPVSSVYPNLPSSSSKLRLPFSRKKSAATTTSTTSITLESQSTFSLSPSPPRPSYLTRTSTASDSDNSVHDNNRRLRPPPSKSAIFAAYADPHVVLSTRSLPDDRSSSRRPETPPPPLPLQVPPAISKDSDTKHSKKRSFFTWGSKSTPNTPLGPSSSPHYLKKNLPDSPTEDNSFNLKAFRHVSGTTTTNASDISIAAPRPRQPSIASESSQRISVAAFRELQARRSTADSPVPSFRAPSPGPAHARAMGSTSPFGSNSRPQSVPRENLTQKRRSSNLALTSESDENYSEQEDDDSDADDLRSTSQHRHIPLTRGEGLHRQRTVTKRNSANTDGDERPRFRATKSESGHSSSFTSQSQLQSQFMAGRSRPSPSPAPPVPSQMSGQRSWFGGAKQSNGNGNANAQASETHQEEPQQRSQSSLGFTPPTRQRASMSVSAIMPNAAAKRASMIVAERNGGQFFVVVLV